MEFSFNNVHPSWKPLLYRALADMDQSYIAYLAHDTTWLPGAQHIFNAFSLPLSATRYILFGESPYPRRESANGYAFWDASVGDIWASTGLSKPVNRATSLRNFIKMLLLVGGYLQPHDLSQSAIAAIPKTGLVMTIEELFANILKQGILLLNASLALSSRPVNHEAKYWQVFMQSLLQQLRIYLSEMVPVLEYSTGLQCDAPQPNDQQPTLILFGSIARQITQLAPAEFFPKMIAVHPYNLNFIHDTEVQRLFSPMQLLEKM